MTREIAPSRDSFISPLAFADDPMSNVFGIRKEGDDGRQRGASTRAWRDDSSLLGARSAQESSSRAGTLRKSRNQVLPDPDAATDDKMPDTFYLVRANGTIGALTLCFPPRTSQRQGKRRIERAIPGSPRWRRRRVGRTAEDLAR
jgi:hypothetical protein